MADRYFSDDPLVGNAALLRGSEAHHLLHVMRAKVDDEIIVFDGRGGEWWAQITRLGRAEVEVALRMHRPVERELPTEFALAVSLPKGDRQRWLVEKAVELGVTRVIPITTARSSSVAEPPAKLNRYVIEASKQCGRNRLMEIAKPQPWAEIVIIETSADRLLAHPGGGCLNGTSIDGCSKILAIGPEGGFTPDEVDLGEQHGWRLIGLGERILRIETAATALVARLTIP